MRTESGQQVSLKMATMSDEFIHRQFDDPFIMHITAFLETGRGEIRVLIRNEKRRSLIGLTGDREAPRAPVYRGFHNQPRPSVRASAPCDLSIVDIEAVHGHAS